MKVSIVTVCYNSGDTILDTILSVKNQCYSNIEFIIIDGSSTDNTNEIILDHMDTVNIHLVEADFGLYDAMNKGINLSNGDIIGFLNSDDILATPNTIQLIVDSIGTSDGVYGDVGFYSDNDFKIKTRHYSSKNFNKNKFSKGIMPAHPSCYIRKSCFDLVGFFNINYKISSDFDMLLRIFFETNSQFVYINSEIVKMRVGGISTSGIKANYILNKEILISCKANGLKASWFSILSKYPKKILGYLKKNF